MEYTEIVKKLIGPIMPVGESNADHDRLENLDEMIRLVDDLIGNIADVSAQSSRQEHSIKVAGEKALVFLQGIQGYLNEIIPTSKPAK